MPHPTHRRNQGRNLDLSERRRTLARKKRQKNQALRKVAHIKYQAARARRRLQELKFDTFIVHTAAVKGVKGNDHVDFILQIYAAKGCGFIGIQEAKRNGTSEVMAAENRVYFSGDRSGIKGRKRQHGVGLAVKEEFVQKFGKDGIAIERINERLLKDRILFNQQLLFMFVVTYAPTEDAAEREKAKYLSALNSTVAPVPVREHMFVLADAEARTGKRGEGAGKTESKGLGVHGRDVLNENGKLLLRFAEDNKLALLKYFIAPQKWRILYVPKRQPRQGPRCLDYILTNQAGRRLVRCVSVRSPPLESPNSDHNLV